MNFTFSLPVWGDWHTWNYLRHVLPSHKANKLCGRYVVHTNRADLLRGKIEHDLPECDVEYVDIDPQASYFQFSEYQQQAFEQSEVLMFLQPDAVVRENTFESIRLAVANGYKLVMCVGINTLSNNEDVPHDDRMNVWARDHLYHKLQTDIWGRHDVKMCPLTMFFEDGENFWTRAFYHNPVAVVNDKRGANWVGSTIDWKLNSFFKQDEVRLLDGYEGLVVEVSPPGKFDPHPMTPIVNATEIAMAVKDKIMDCHAMQFTQPLRIVGDVTTKYDALCNDVSAMLQHPLFANAAFRGAK